MTYIKIHWQSRPHHIPQIRIASTSSPASGLSLSRRAAEYAVRRPLSPSLASARIKQRTLRKVKSSNLTPVPSNFEEAKAQAPCQLQAPRRQFNSPRSLRSHPDRFFHLPLQRCSIVPFTDGACHSTCRIRRQPRPISDKVLSQDESMTSSRQPYCTPTHRHRRTVQHSISLGPPTDPSRVHKTLRRRMTGIDRPNKSRTNKPKAIVSGHFPTVKQAQESSKGILRPRSLAAIGSSAPSSQCIKSVVKSMEPGSRKQKSELFSSKNSRLSVAKSRSPSERQQLKKFQKELERHLCQTRNLPRQQSSTSSATPLSTYTIREFLPYRAEFAAANLAVTSDEQRGMKTGKLDFYQNPDLFTVETKRAQDISGGVSPDIAYQVAQIKTSQSSDSNATTVLAFTPPHGSKNRKTLNPGPKEQYSGSVATEFCANHKSELKTSPISLKSTTKQRLPWLRDIRSPALTDPPIAVADVNECGQYQSLPCSVVETPQLPTTEADTVPVGEGNEHINLHQDEAKGNLLELLSSKRQLHLQIPTNDLCNEQHEDTNDHRRVEARSCNSNGYSSAFNIPHKPISASLDKSHLLKESMCVPGLQPMSVGNIVSSPLQCKAPLFGCPRSQEQIASLSLLDDNKEKYATFVTDSDSPQSSSTISQPSSLSRLDVYSAHSCHQKAVSSNTQNFRGSNHGRRRLPHSPIILQSRGKISLLRSAHCNKITRKSHALGMLSSSTITSLGSVNTTQTHTDIVPDKAIFRGLQVATSAACDEDVDTWIEEITGIGVRRLLADLSRFDGLGINALANVARRAAKQRREEVRKWELARTKNKVGSP